MLPGAWMYCKQGYVHPDVAAYICVGFFLGSLLGAELAANLGNSQLERVFGVAMLAIALKMTLAK